MFNENEITEGLARRPAEGLPATMAERAAVDWTLFKETQTSMAAQSSLYDEYEDYLGEVERVTGRRLPNPYNQEPRRRAYMEERVEREVRELRDQYPELNVRTPDDIRAKIASDREALRRKQAEVQARTIDWPVSVAGGLATMGAAVTDPPVLASMLVGAPAASGILRGALIEGGIGVATEIPIQASVQFGRTEFGEEPSLSEGLQGIAAAGGGGFLFSAILRSMGRMVAPVSRGTRNLLDRARGLKETPEVRAARDYLERKVELEEASPFGDYPRAREEHVARLSEATRAIMEGRAPDMPVRPRNPVRRDISESEITPDIPEAVESIGAFAKRAAGVDERARAAVEIASEALARGTEGVTELQRELVSRQPKTESLLSFLKRTGGITDEGGELRHMGLTPRTRPGLLRKQGRSLDDATLAAWEAGYLPGDARPEINALLEAIRSELHGAPVYRMEDLEARVQREAMDDFLDALTDADIDPRKLKPTEFKQALREMTESVIAREALGEMRMGDAAKESVNLEAAEQEALDAFTETEVRRLYEGAEDTELVFQTEDGTQRQKVKDLYDELAGDMQDYESLTFCTGRP